MAVIDCTLSEFKVSGFLGFTPPIGTKMPDNEEILAREASLNTMMPFTKQRPLAVTENSSTTEIQAHTTFSLQTAGLTLTLGNAAFNGCRVKVLNSSGGSAQVIYSAKTKAIHAGKFAEFEFTVNGWIIASSGSGAGDSALPVFALSVPFLVASDKRELTIKAGTKIDIGAGANARTFFAEEDMILNVASLLDTGSLVNGKDYYVFGCPDSGDGVLIKISLDKENPQGFDPADVELIGGFHTLCVNAGSGMTYVEGGVTLQHPLNGYVANDILPYSVWCLNHRPYSEPEGMVYIPSLDFWCDIYLQSGSGKNTKSAYEGAITRSRQYVDFVEDQFCVLKELLDDGEFAAAMLGSNEETVVNGASEAGATTGGAGGRLDTANRRMLSIYGVEEGCGSLWQWLRTTAAAGRQGTIYGQTATTPTYGDIVVTTSSYGPYGQAGGKGSFWGLAGALLAGGNWSHAADCGARARGATGARSCADTGSGGRGRSRPKRI